MKYQENVLHPNTINAFHNTDKQMTASRLQGTQRQSLEMLCMFKGATDGCGIHGRDSFSMNVTYTYIVTLQDV